MAQIFKQYETNDDGILLEARASAQGQDVPCLHGFLARKYRSVAEIPYEPANAFLHEYIATQAEVYERENGIKVDALGHIEGFWTHVDRVLPPLGSFYLIWTDDHRLVGTGAMRRVDETTGEMKHLYVRPEARGTGLGRWLVEQRISDAQTLGLKCMIADTVRGNVEMPALYKNLGFEETAPNQISTSVNIAPEVAAGLRFFRKQI